MLQCRAISEGVRFLAPAIIAGIYTPEEIEDVIHVDEAKPVKKPKGKRKQKALPPKPEPEPEPEPKPEPEPEPVFFEETVIVGETETIDVDEIEKADPELEVFEKDKKPKLRMLAKGVIDWASEYFLETDSVQGLLENWVGETLGAGGKIPANMWKPKSEEYKAFNQLRDHINTVPENERCDRLQRILTGEIKTFDEDEK
jgi:hypothetical protein